MPFEEGHEKIGGRAKGTPNKKTLLRAAAVLADKGLSPTEELVKIAQDEGTPVDTRISLWKFLQSYVEAPQTLAVPIASESPEGSKERAAQIAAHLAEASKPMEPATNEPPRA